MPFWSWDGVCTPSYDLANRVQSVVNGRAATVTFAHGPDGARAKKFSPQGETLYADANAEYGSATGFITRYPHMDVKVMGNAKYFLHRDHLSSVRFVTDESGAASISANRTLRAIAETLGFIPVKTAEYKDESNRKQRNNTAISDSSTNKNDQNESQ